MIVLLAAASFAADVDRVPEDFPTLQAAIDGGSAPVIELGPGSWAGATVTRPVQIVGVDGPAITSGPMVRGVRVGLALTGAADDTHVEGVIFDCSSPKLDLGVFASAARLGGSPDRVTVAYNLFYECAQGVTNAGAPVTSCDDERVDGGDDWLIEGNAFEGIVARSDRGASGGGNGIVVHNARGAEVHANQFLGDVASSGAFLTSGVMLSGCFDCTVADNVFQTSGGSAWWTGVANLGAFLRDGAASRNVVLAGNDASGDGARTAWVSLDSVGTDLVDNAGVAFVEHRTCGDGATR
jgi:hypothetical protein